MIPVMYLRVGTQAQLSTFNSDRQSTDWTYQWTTEDVVKHFANYPHFFRRLYNPLTVAELWNDLCPETREQLDAAFVGYELAIGRY